MPSKTKKKIEPEGKGGILSEMARKLFLTGLGAIFVTEESIRSALTELKLPKDAMGYVVDQAKKQKNDLITVVATELSNFLSKLKVHEEIQKALSKLQIHIEAKLSFSPHGKALAKEIDIDVKEKA